MACMTVLVFFEAPLATSLVTVFLGQAMFAKRPSLAQAARDLQSPIRTTVVVRPGRAGRSHRVVDCPAV